MSRGGADARAAVVTGSSAGIGRAVALELARHGLSVVVTARTLDRAAAVAQEISTAGGQATAVAADLLHSDDGAQVVVEQALESFGRLDVLVNNAGAGQVADSDAVELEEFRRIVELDLTAPFACAQAAGRVMLEQGSGVIVNVSSITGHVGLARRAAYTAAKHGLEGLTKALAAEWSPRGVRVVSVAPAYVATELLQGTMAAGGFTSQDVASRTPLRRLAEPQEVADVVAFLASERASYITGSSVLVDGGWTADGGWRPT